MMLLFQFDEDMDNPFAAPAMVAGWAAVAIHFATTGAHRVCARRHRTERMTHFSLRGGVL
jgi:hypothetical protein